MDVFLSELWSGIRRVLGEKDAQALVQSQADAAAVSGSFWNAAFSGDRAALLKHCGKDHTVWMQRGEVGETVFHIAFLRADLPMAKWLLEQCPELVSTVYANPPFRGESALHMAIAKRMSVDAVRWLVSRDPSLVHGRATGTYFEPSGQFPFGETPLAFAVSVNEPSLVRVLVEECGADMLQRDSVCGNTAMHWAVWHDRRQMVLLLEELWESVQAQRRARGALNVAPLVPDAMRSPHVYSPEEVPLDFQLSDVVNLEGLTPHVLAAKLSRLDLFLWMWDRKCVPIWKYVHVRSDLYPLDGIDDIVDLLDETARSQASGGSTTPAPIPSRLALAALPPKGSGILRRVTAVELLTLDSSAGPVMRTPSFKRLLEVKWSAYAGKIFLYRFIYTCIFLILLTGTIVMRSEGVSDAVVSASFLSAPHCRAPGSGVLDAFLQLPQRPPHCSSLALCELLLAFFALSKLALTVMDLHGVGWSSFFSAKGSTALERTCSVFFCGGIAVWPVLQAAGMHAALPPLIAALCICSWGYLLWFALGFELTAQFVVMLLEMLVTDVVRFFSVSSIVVAAFSTVFFVISMRGASAPTSPLLGIGWNSLVSLIGSEIFSGSSGADSSAIEKEGPAFIFFQFLFFLFCIIMVNVLIASMTDTFNTVKSNAQIGAMLERARIIKHIEHTMTRAQRLGLAKYWILGPGSVGACLSIENTDLPLLRHEANNLVAEEEILSVRQHTAAQQQLPVGKLLQALTPAYAEPAGGGAEPEGAAGVGTSVRRRRAGSLVAAGAGAARARRTPSRGIGIGG